MPIMRALLDSELFGGLGEQHCWTLSRMGEPLQLKAGHLLFKLGEESHTLFIVTEGKIELTFPLLVMGELREVRFQTLETGRTVAWSALVPPHKLTMTARAITDASVIQFERKTLLAHFLREPAVGYATLSNLAVVIGARLHELQALWMREVQRNVSQTYR